MRDLPLDIYLFIPLEPKALTARSMLLNLGPRGIYWFLSLNDVSLWNVQMWDESAGVVCEEPLK